MDIRIDIAPKEIAVKFDSFQAGVNVAPVAVDDSATTEFETSVLIAVLDNDVDTSPLSIESFTQGSNGTVTQEGNSLRYTPDELFSGGDSFTYTVTDGEMTDTGTVNITVSEAPNNAPVAVNDSVTTPFETSVLIDVLQNDTDGDPGDTLVIQSVGTPSNGTAVIEGGQIRYTPNNGYSGPDSFTYVVSDGTDTDTATVSITVEDSALYSFGDAINLDGVDDYVLINTALNTTEFTVSLWFKLPTVGANNRIVAGAISTDWIDVRSSGVINIRLSSGGVNFTVPSISSSTWYHLLVARNSSSQTRLFLNGVESSSGPQVVLGNCTYSSLGRQVGVAFTACVLDDCLFNSSYGNPATEAAAIYNGGAGADPLISIPLAEQLYRFNGNLNNDGSLGGSATAFNLAPNPYTPHV